MDKSAYTTILLEQLLGNFARHIKSTIGLSSKKCSPNSAECSIFLYDQRRDAYVLRASTIDIPYLGKAEVDTRKEKKILYDNNGDHVGLTATAIFSAKYVLSNDLKRDQRHGKKNSSPELKYKYCEFDDESIKSLIVAPIISAHDRRYFAQDKKDKESVIGVVRLVRSIKSPKTFKDQDVKKLRELINDKQTDIQSCTFLSDLIELGSHTDLKSLCTQAATVFSNILSAKGCSIFLLDEKASKPDQKIYKCFGTTGLSILKNNQMKPIKDPLTNKDAWYTYLPKYKPPPIHNNNDRPTIPLTVGVIRARISIFAPDIHSNDELPFPKGYGINRRKDHGQVAEYFLDKNNKYLKAHSVLYSPIFYRDPNNENIDVLGVVRVSSVNKNAFTSDQKHLFVSMVESLSKAITFSKLVEFIDNISKTNDRKKLFGYIVDNIPKFIGAKDCALLLKEGDKLKYGAVWSSSEGCKSGDQLDTSIYKDYDLSDDNNRGYTGFVAVENKTLLFNGHEELQEAIKEMGCPDIPQHNQASGEDPFRFLGVPILDILDYKKVIAVIRICKTQDSSRLTIEDKQLLELISRRIQPHIAQILQNEEEKEKIKFVKDHYFSSCLHEHIMSIDTTQKQRPNINNIKVFLSEINVDTRIESVISKFISKLWHDYDYEEDGLCKVLDKFEFFNASILSDIPYYRDHYIHQFTVYLIGLSIINSLSEELNNIFIESYPFALPDKGKKGKEVNLKYIERMWLFTALFHDVAYPLETVNEWLNKVFQNFLRGPVDSPYLPVKLESLLFAPDYIDRIDQLAKYHIDNYDNLKRMDMRRIIINTLLGNKKDGRLDHGIMGALLLLSCDKLKVDELLPCASAIALHNRLYYDQNVIPVSFEKHPLAFLLIYCDILHEWGRGYPEDNGNNVNTKLTNFTLRSTWQDVKEMGIEDIDLPKQKDKLWIYSKLMMNEDIMTQKKHNELRASFLRLHSKDILFGIHLNNKFYSSHIRAFPPKASSSSK